MLDRVYIQDQPTQLPLKDTNLARHRQLLAYRAHLKGTILRQLRKIYRDSNITTKELAEGLGVDYETARARIAGEVDLSLEMLSDLAVAVGHRIEFKVVRI